MLPLLNPVNILRSSDAFRAVSSIPINPVDVVRSSDAGRAVSGIAGSLSAFMAMMGMGQFGGSQSRGGSASEKQPINLQFARYVDGINIRLDKLIAASSVFAKIQKRLNPEQIRESGQPISVDEEEDWDKDKERGDTLLPAIAGFLAQLGTRKFWAEALAAISSTIRRWGSSLLKAGSNFLKGLWKGIKNSASFISNATKKLFSGLKINERIASSVKGVRNLNFARMMKGLRIIGKSLPIVSTLLVPAFEIAENSPQITALGEKLDKGEITQDEYDEQVSEIVTKIAFKSIGIVAGAAGGAIVGQALLPAVPIVPALAGGIVGALAGGEAGQMLAQKLAPSIEKGIMTGAIGPAVKNIQEAFSSQSFLKEILLKTGLNEKQVNSILKQNQVTKTPASSTSQGTAQHSSLQMNATSSTSSVSRTISDTTSSKSVSNMISNSTESVENNSFSSQSLSSSTNTSKESSLVMQSSSSIKDISSTLTQTPTASRTFSSERTEMNETQTIIINGVVREETTRVISAPAPAEKRTSLGKMIQPNIAAAYA